MFIVFPVIVIVILIALVALAVKVWLWVDLVMHDTYCMCGRCKDEAIRKAVQRSEWLRYSDEVRRAVEEMERAARGER